MEFNWPGEKLVLKLYESLADNGVPALLGPWQTRRTAEAEADKMRILAQAEKDAAAIKAGDVTVQVTSDTARLELTSEEKGRPTRREPALDLEKMAASVASAELADSIRREVNATKAVLVAEDILSRDTQEPSDNNIDGDWLHSWRDCAGRVSAEQLQELWGRVLAGEVKQPGSFSMRTLEFLKGLSKKEAELISSAATFVIGEKIHREKSGYLAKAGLDFGQLLYLQEIGILAGVESSSLTSRYASTVPGSFRTGLKSENRGLLIKHADANKHLHISSYSITQLGMEMLRLCKVDVNEDYFWSIASDIANQGYQVTAVEFNQEGKPINPQEITPKAHSHA
ncbi:DUF2806 domain-containing protein [Microbulbifer sp. EKSA005]|uniref:DUF2806 domain-containing protein n=1 Tax=Microbulbifer sp. EKSA005 TaxID=3243364 RepID=UPI0040418BAC